MTNAPPPFSAVIQGNFQILPNPTAEPVAANMNRILDDHWPCIDSLLLDMTYLLYAIMHYTLSDEIMNVLCNNKKAGFKYAFIKKLEAGLVLAGWEVKSLKSGNGQLSESYISIKKDEVFLANAHIKTLSTKNQMSLQEPTAKRKLLLNRKEINMLQGQVSQKGLAIVPLKIYSKNGIIKIEIALSKGKKLHDKREDQKKKDWQRQKDRLKKLV
jgi:SsrA-binding protein